MSISQYAATSAAAIKHETYQSSSDEDDDDGYDYDPEITLGEIDKSKTINFSICANYTNWKPREAFRELVQNWRDAIIKCFHLAERDFCVIREEKSSGRNTEIVYKALRLLPDDKKEWVGYIRFKARDGEGTIDIANRSATLQPWHLDLGGTSKAGDGQQAGAHGEGLKVAVLVLMRGRQNHSVRCRSGGFNWRFNFTTRGRLVVRLRRMSPENISRAEDQAQRLSMRTLLPFAVKPESDVHFVIGESQKGLNESGNSVKRSPVKLEEFEAWTKAALFLHTAQDGDIISTDQGDLLTSPQLLGNIYLKGLLLRESTPSRPASITNQKLKFGYNFAHGRTNRERQSVAGADEESKAILAIWGRVLAAKPEMVEELHAMLNTTEHQYADVCGAKRHMTVEMASRLKEYLLGAQFTGKWYYCGEEKSRNPRLDHIIRGLGCEGVELTKTYWTILRNHGLVRTAEEEEHRRFVAAAPVAAPETTFAAAVYHLLRACARACPQTDGINFSFVRAGQLHLQLFFSEAERLFRIHERCLSVDGAVAELGLPDDLVEADVIFHTVKRLFADAVEQLPRGAFLTDDTRTAEWRRKLEISLAEQRLLNYLRLADLSLYMFTSAGRVDFRERWQAISRWIPDVEIEVQCHLAYRCSHLRDSLLITEDAGSENLDCIARGDLREPAQQNGENERIFPTCQVYRCDNPSQLHCEFEVDEGQEYFVVLMTPTDPFSFAVLSKVDSLPYDLSSISGDSSMITSSSSDSVSLSDFSSVTSPRPLEELEYSAPEPPRSRARSPRAVQNAGGVNGGAKSSSPESEPVAIDGDSSPANAPSAAAESDVTDVSTPDIVTAPPGSLVLGPRLQSLDIFEINRNRWYEAKSSENVRAVIGIVKGERYLPGEPRKRRRVDGEGDEY